VIDVTHQCEDRSMLFAITVLHGQKKTRISVNSHLTKLGRWNGNVFSSPADTFYGKKLFQPSANLQIA
jgi:hypothetical protein